MLLLTGIIGAVSLVQRRADQAGRPEPVSVPAAAAAGGGVAVLEPLPVEPPDDLKRIRGIGPKLERVLHRHGITTFAQIAALTPEQVEELSVQLPEFKGRIERDGWLEQARRLAEEGRHD